MQQNLASRSNKYSYFFKLIFRDYPAPRRRSLRFFFSECSSESENRHSSSPLAFLILSLFSEVTNPERGISLGCSMRYATFALRTSSGADESMCQEDIPSIPKSFTYYRVSRNRRLFFNDEFHTINNRNLDVSLAEAQRIVVLEQ